jgi:hypothetical protein
VTSRRSWGSFGPPAGGFEDEAVDAEAGPGVGEVEVTAAA